MTQRESRLVVGGVVCLDQLTTRSHHTENSRHPGERESPSQTGRVSAQELGHHRSDGNQHRMKKRQVCVVCVCTGGVEGRERRTRQQQGESSHIRMKTTSEKRALKEQIRTQTREGNNEFNKATLSCLVPSTLLIVFYLKSFLYGNRDTQLQTACLHTICRSICEKQKTEECSDSL